MPKRVSTKTGSELFIVDNSDDEWKVIRYLRDWCEISKAIDIATAYFEIGSLLSLEGEWQKVDEIRVLMGDEVAQRTAAAFARSLDAKLARLDSSIESEKDKDDFLTGVPAIVAAIQSGKIKFRVYKKAKFHAKAYITHARLEVVGSAALVSVLELPEHLRHVRVPPKSIYSNKGDCVKMFDELMSDGSVSKPTGGEYTHELHNTAVASALALAAEIPALYDKIYEDFPDAYNDGEGRFGRLTVVKMAKDMRSKPMTHFTAQPVEYSYPDGLIMPLVYGLRSLIRRDANGLVRWSEDPAAFLNDCLVPIVKKYRVIMDAFRADPQKIGKNEGSYELVLDAFETELLKRQAV